MLSDDQVRHVAKLARLKIDDKNISKFAKQLSEVLEYMDILNEVDTENIEITSQVTGLENIMADDEIKKGKADREELLQCSELPIDSNQIRVQKAI